MAKANLILVWKFLKPQSNRFDKFQSALDNIFRGLKVHLHGSTATKLTGSHIFWIEVVLIYRTSSLCDSVATCRVVSEPSGTILIMLILIFINRYSRDWKKWKPVSYLGVELCKWPFKGHNETWAPENMKVSSQSVRDWDILNRNSLQVVRFLYSNNIHDRTLV